MAEIMPGSASAMMHQSLPGSRGARFPAVAHVLAAARQQQAAGRTEVLVVRGDDLRTVQRAGEIDEAIGIGFTTELRWCIHTQTRKATVRIEIHAQMRARRFVGLTSRIVAMAASLPAITAGSSGVSPVFDWSGIVADQAGFDRSPPADVAA